MKILLLSIQVLLLLDGLPKVCDASSGEIFVGFHSYEEFLHILESSTTNGVTADGEEWKEEGFQWMIDTLLEQYGCGEHSEEDVCEVR